MKKTIVTLSVIAMITLVISSMSLSVKAHPGRTDSNGGHTNRSTGEYHYHHGYPAHDHYDMDGDGKVDCPYDFDGKTNHSSKSSQSSQTHSEPETKAPSEPPAKAPAEPEPKKKDQSILSGIIALVLFVFYMFVLPLLMS